MGNGLISFIIPAKNEEKRIGRAIASIKRACRRQKIEIIVVDNGSQDATCAVAAKAGATVLELPGATVAGLRNAGARQAGGGILVFVDADVEVLPGFLEAAHSWIERRDVGIVTGYIGIPADAGWVERTWALGRGGGKEVGKVHWSSSMNMIVARRAYLAAGGFAEDMQTCEDVDFSGRVRRAGFSIIYHPQVQVVHHGEAKSLSQLLRKEFWRGRSILSLVARHPADMRRWLGLLQLLFFAGAMAAVCVSLIWGQQRVFAAAWGGLVLLPVLRTLRAVKGSGMLHPVGQLFAVWSTYYVARTAALLLAVMTLGASGRTYCARG